MSASPLPVAGESSVRHSGIAGSVRPNPTAGDAEVIRRGFDCYRVEFAAVTQRAQRRFEACEWTEIQGDARARLDIYDHVLDNVVAELRGVMGDGAEDPAQWVRLKAQYAELVAGHEAEELAETFFNSVTRKIFTTVGVNPTIEFVDYKFGRISTGLPATPYRSYSRRESTAALVRLVLESFPFSAPYRNLEHDAGHVARELEAHWEDGNVPLGFEAIEVLEPIFYRRKGAYLIGRVVGVNRVMPMVLALTNSADGISVDAALFTEQEVSIIFSFTRSHFHADVSAPYDIVRFLRSLVPLKPVADLYNALGYHKHGKTELFRDLQRHLASTEERFDIAPGVPGTVMTVFAMPGLDVVFKIIRDGFEYPKRTTRFEVTRRYQLVFGHDRAGRLVDAQEFEHLVIPKHRFSETLLTDLASKASRSVTVSDQDVTIKHVYVSRRVKPLDLYLRDADAASARRIVLDYGQAIRDLAATNVFPGDLLLKNFGVTRHGRVVFYDYDELRLLNECTFAVMPTPRTHEEEMAAEPWFFVGHDTVFPKELLTFFEVKGELRDVFLEHHASIFDVEFWRDLQLRARASEVFDIFPYGAERRLERLTATH